MKELSMAQLQKYLKLKYDNGQTSTGLFMKLVEEVGEVAEVINQLEGRKAHTDTHPLEKELVDVIHYTVAIASINNIDLSSAIIEKDKQASVKYNQTPDLDTFLS